MYIILLILIVVLIVITYITDQDVVSPGIIICFSWLICSVIAFSFEEQWGISISLSATLFVVAALAFFVLGQILSKIYWQSAKVKSKNKFSITREVVLSREANVMIQVLLVFVVCLNFFLKYKYSVQSGNVSGVSLMLKYIRGADETVLPGYASFMVRIANVLGTVCTFLLCRAIVFKDKRIWSYAVGFLAKIFNGWLTGGRTWLIHLICEIFIYFVFLYKNKNGWKKIGNFKIIIVGAASFCAFLYLFPRLGLLIGKGVGRDPSEIIGYYAGSSIALFSNWIDNSWDVFQQNKYFGENTLFGVYNFLRIIGIDFPVSETPLEFTYIPHFYSNIYTALRRYIQDYGVIGMLIIQMFLGAFYGFIYEKIKSTRNTGGLLLFYGMIFYPIAEHPIEERFLCKVLTMGSVFEIVMAIMLLNMILRRKRV